MLNNTAYWPFSTWVRFSNILSTIRKKVEEANASYDQNLTKCKRKLEKIIPSLNDSVKELSERVLNTLSANTNADIYKTVYFINDVK